jgi:hypothetical protein
VAEHDSPFVLPPQTVYVISRRHSDNSAAPEVLRVYEDLNHARFDLSLVDGDYGKIYELHTVPLVSGGVA